MSARNLTVTAALVALLLCPANAQAVKVFLNYSNQTSNSVCAGGVESTYAADNAARTKTLLQGYGFDVRTSDDFYGSNAAAASWGAASFLSIHSNAGGGHGAETLKGWYGNSSAFATKIQAGLMSKIPYQSRGVKSGSCGGGRCKVLNYSGQTAALVEVVFHDCCVNSGYQGHPPSEAAYLKSTSGRQTIATGLAKGICTYHGVTCSSSTPPPATNGSIKGVVYRSGDLNQHVFPATVSLSTGASKPYDGSAVWSFDVPAGSNYSITARATGYTTATRNCGAVTSGATTWCSIELVPDVPSTGVLQGVVYQGGDPANHVVPANVTLSNGSTATYTGATAWSFRLNPATYTVTVSATGFQTRAGVACPAVTAGGTAQCNVELQPLPPPDAGQPQPDAAEPEPDAAIVVDDASSGDDVVSGVVDGGTVDSGAAENVTEEPAVELEVVEIGMGGCSSVSGAGTATGLWGLLALAVALRWRRRG